MGTHYRGNRREVLALDTFIKLVRAAETINTVLNRRLVQAGLSATQFGTLETLYHLGSLPANRLAHKLLKSGGNLTTVLDNLEKRGLICRERDSADRRSVTIHLLEAGRSLIESILPAHAEFIADQMNHLSETEQQQLAVLCRKLGTAIESHNHLHTKSNSHNP